MGGLQSAWTRLVPPMLLLAASPALVRDLLLHHAQLGRGDVGSTGPGQDGVHFLLLLLHGRLLAGRWLAVGRRGGGATPPPLVPLIAAAAPAVMPIAVAIPDRGKRNQHELTVNSEFKTQTRFLRVTENYVLGCSNPGLFLWTCALWTGISPFLWTGLVSWTWSRICPVFSTRTRTCPNLWIWICLSLPLLIHLVPWKRIRLVLWTQICWAPWVGISEREK